MDLGGIGAGPLAAEVRFKGLVRFLASGACDLRKSNGTTHAIEYFNITGKLGGNVDSEGVLNDCMRAHH